MKWIRIIAIFGMGSLLMAQGVDQNLMVTSGVEAGIDKGDSLNRAIYYVCIPADYSGNIYFRIFDADMGGRFDQSEVQSATRYSLFGEGQIRRGLFALEDALEAQEPLLQLTLGKDRYYDNRWRTLGSYTKEAGELRDDGYCFQLIVDGIVGNGRNYYQLFVSAHDKENIGIPGIRISSPAMSFPLTTNRRQATQLRFRVPAQAESIHIYNFDGDIERSPNRMYFESNYRSDIPLTVSDDASGKESGIRIDDVEKGELAAIVIEENVITNNVQFWVRDDQGEIIELIYPPQIFPVNHLPQPEIELIPLSECNSLMLDASGSTDADGDELRFSWKIEDGVSKTGSRIVHNFGMPGNYEVLLSVEDNSGYIANTGRYLTTVTVNEPPTARIQAAKRGIPNQVLEYDASQSVDNDGQIVKYLWDFGDGWRASGAHVDHQFAQAGKYIVTLTVEDDGLSLCNRDKTAIQVWINAAPVAKLNQAKTIAAIDELIQFDAEGSIDSDGDLVQFRWDFGDGLTGDGYEVAHAYAEPGTYEITLRVYDDAEVGNSMDEIRSRIIINDPPVPKFVFEPIVAAEEVTLFDAASSYDPDGEIIEYAWNFGDGFTKKGEKVDHQYAQPGTYEVTLRIQDETPTLNNHATIRSSIRINDPTIVDAGGDRLVNSSQVVFDGGGSTDSDDDIIDYFWDFGDNITAHGQQVVHTYAYPGSYRVRLTTTDASGTITADQFQEVQVIVNHPPIADAGMDQIVAPGEKCRLDGGFSNDPDGKITQYRWEVEEDTFLEGRRVEYQYERPGIYQVRLTVQDDTGAEDYHYTTVTVNAAPQPVISPVGRLGPGEEYSFEAGLSFDTDGSIRSYEWDFGDETPVQTGQMVTHSYAESGRYTITLTVTDDSPANNNIVSTSQSVPVNYRPKADAGADILTCDQRVRFDGARSSDPDGDLLTYYWDFGDGNTATGMQIVHDYQSPGIYPVVLRVDDGQSLKNSNHITTIKVHVNSPPVAIASCLHDTICAGEPLMLDAGASFDPEQGLLRFQWDFGDGGTAEGVNPIHSYKRGGDYPIEVTVLDDSNLPCNSSVAKLLVHVIDAPVAEAGEDQIVCANTVVHFDGNKSTGGGRSIKSFGWDFGDGTLGGGMTPTHVYTTAGKYTVRLTITVPEIGDCENTSDDELTVTVISAPTASFTARSFGCVGDEFEFDGSLSDPGNSVIEQYLWDFGDGSTENGIKVVHTYAQPGTYPVRLQVKTESELGCNTASVSKTVVINDPPKAHFTIAESDQTPSTAELYTTETSTLLNFNASQSGDSDGFIKEFAWDFGNGRKARGVNIQHQYDRPGEYRVELLVTDNSQTVCNTDRIYKTVRVLAPVELTIQAPPAGFVNDVQVFQSQPNQRVAALGKPFEWIFSDGDTLQGAEIRRAFAEAGKYQVQVRCGSVLSPAHTIIIDDIPLIKVPGSVRLDVNEKYQFTPVIHNPHSIPIVLQWDFGDGSVVDVSAAKHAFAEPGEYTAELLVWYQKIGNGQARRYGVPVTVYAAPEVVIRYTPQEVFAGGARDEVTFTAEVHAYAGKLNYTWDFGDGARAVGKVVKHQFPAPYEYTVTLTLSNAERASTVKYVIQQKVDVNSRK